MCLKSVAILSVALTNEPTCCVSDTSGLRDRCRRFGLSLVRRFFWPSSDLDQRFADRKPRKADGGLEHFVARSTFHEPDTRKRSRGADLGSSRHLQTARRGEVGPALSHPRRVASRPSHRSQRKTGSGRAISCPWTLCTS